MRNLNLAADPPPLRQPKPKHLSAPAGPLPGWPPDARAGIEAWRETAVRMPFLCFAGFLLFEPVARLALLWRFPMLARVELALSCCGVA